MLIQPKPALVDPHRQRARFANEREHERRVRLVVDFVGRADLLDLAVAGNSSAQASLHLARYARMATIVMRGERLNDNVCEYLVDRIKHTPNIEIIPQTEIIALHGGDMLKGVTRGAHHRDKLPVPLSRGRA
jgi:hypothetical protein